MQRNEEQQRRSTRHNPSNSLSSNNSTTTSNPPYPLRRSISIGRISSNDENAPASIKVVVPTRRPSTARSRSNSIKEGLGNLNRWSQSTASSVIATHTRSKSNSLSQRESSASSDGPPPTTPSPNKNSQQSASPEDKQPQLPPIVTLPSLRQSVESSSPSQLLSATSDTGSDYPERSRRIPPRLRAASITERLEQSPSEPDTPTRRPRRKEDGARKGHRRQLSQGSSGTFSSDRSKERNSRQPSQKAMLSKALQKANTAVLLDNAQNFEGAIQAYSEACSLLQQVMLRSSGEDDKRKLEAIRSTYSSRIAELQKIAPQSREDSKALPARPRSADYRVERFIQAGNPEDRAYSAQQIQPPPRRDSHQPSPFENGHYRPNANSTEQRGESRSFSKSPMRDRVVETSASLALPMDQQYMPPPLSPGRRPPSPSAVYGSYVPTGALLPPRRDSNASTQGHKRATSSESMSWLDTIDESGGSTVSSVHSRTSSFGVRRKHIRVPSTATEAEFDTALDAAIEAAYDEGYEPIAEPRSATTHEANEEDIMTNMRSKIALAKERVRQTERDQEAAFGRERRRQPSRQDSVADYDDGNDSEEEERMLEEMTRGYVMDDFEFGLHSKSALPRESDSSGFSGRTWNSSIGSTPNTAGTSLTTVTEGGTTPHLPGIKPRTPPLMHPPPIQALPPPPTQSQPPSLLPPPPPKSAGNQSVRSRRLSGQNAKQLKIETAPGQPPSVLPPSPPQASLQQQPKTAGMISHAQGSSLSRPSIPMSAIVRKPSSPLPAPLEAAPPLPGLSGNQSFEGDTFGYIRSVSPSRSLSRPALRKNFSSSSLKNLKSRNLSVSGIDDEVSPHTPGSMGRENGRIPTMPSLPTPIANSFREKINGQASGGMYLFDSDIHSPESPGSPNPLASSAPIPLEPCPVDNLLRPFWLMRALYQTIAHPRGGYLSTKLFVPRDVWRVKGVKIKGLEDKISNCDYLTAALQNLAKVDTFDADAVLDEMQNFETVLEQVQTNLTKKLGSEVGVHGANGLFKDAQLGGDLDGSTLGPKSAGSSKSTFSWKRLRSKNSNANIANGQSAKFAPSDRSNSMSTVPMTSMANVRFAKREVSHVQLVGPHANYMGALARLFDAAQVIDQIARQVEDPGLKHLNSTYVGLELCARHAAEFFGFYICRFVLTDISLLLDKFIKRGSEWVIQ